VSKPGKEPNQLTKAKKLIEELEIKEAVTLTQWSQEALDLCKHIMALEDDIHDPSWDEIVEEADKVMHNFDRLEPLITKHGPRYMISRER